MHRDPELLSFASENLLRHLDALLSQADGVLNRPEDIEYVHKMRVASRRLRAALPLFLDCLPRKKAAAWTEAIRSITRALGAARDSDVQLDHLAEFSAQVSDPAIKPGLARLVLRINQRRTRYQARVERELTRFLASGVPEQMHTLLAPALPGPDLPPPTPALYRRAQSAVRERLGEFLAFDEFVPRPECVEELHAMRIAAKHLRYTLETFAPLYGGGLKRWLNAVRDTQEQIGEIHDCDVWIAAMPAFEEKERARTRDYFGHERPMKRLVPGFQAYLEYRRIERAGRYEAFAAQWQTWKEKGVWLALSPALDVPLPDLAPVYPPLAADLEE